MASIKRNYIYSLLYQLLSIGIPVITVPYVSRVFGPEKLGVFSYVNTIGLYFVMFSMLGLANYGNREIAAVRDNVNLRNKCFSEIYYMQIITSIISICVFIFAFLPFQNDSLLEYYTVLLLLVISPLFDVNWFFWGMEEFGITVFRNTIVKIISFLSIIIFVKTPEDLRLYVMIYALSALVSVCLLWPSLMKRVSFVKVSIKSVLSRFKPNIMLFVPVLAISIYKYMDRIMIGYYSFEETGYYDNSEKVTTLLFGIIASLGTVMLPRISYLINNGQKEKAADYTNKSLDFVMLVSIGMAFGLSGIVPNFIPLFFGDGFEKCVLLICLLAPTLVFCSWANVIRTQILIPFKKDRVYIVSVVAGAVINFTANILFIPKLGAIGAVIGTLSAEFFVAFIQTFLIRNEFSFKRELKKTFFYLTFGIILFVILIMENFILHYDILIKLVIQLTTGFLLFLFFSFRVASIRRFAFSILNKRSRLC